MSEPIDDGGPAFPLPVQNDIDCHGRATSGYGGMTLRDYFAGQALAGMCADNTCNGTDAEFAKSAYGYADAMLAARKANQ